MRSLAVCGGPRPPTKQPTRKGRHRGSIVLCVGSQIIVKLEHFGWCIGTLTEKNTNRRRKINGKMVNFIAKFEIDEGNTELSLEAAQYDTLAEADYESWLMLEPEAGPP